MKEKRGLSPIIATMLLIAIIIVIGLIIFLWLRGINEEAITKFEGTNIKLICEEVAFEASYSDGSLYILNLGNVPIYKIKVKMEGEGAHSTKTLEEADGWPYFGLPQGGSYSGALSYDVGSIKLLAIPVLVGTSNSGDLSYTCEDRHGYEILL